MNTTDYVIDILLIAVIFRQVRPHQLTLSNAALPLVLVVVAGGLYLGPVTIKGNDLALIIIWLAVWPTGSGKTRPVGSWPEPVPSR